MRITKCECGEILENGLGPSSIPILTEWLNKLPSSHIFYLPACNHDKNYHKGKTEDDRTRADFEFYHEMLCAIEDNCRWYSKWWYRLQAKRNYFFVHALGYCFFNYKGCKKAET